MSAMDLRQYLYYRSRNPVKKVMKVRFRENILYGQNQECRDALENRVHKHEEEWWFIKPDRKNNCESCLIEYEHILCSPKYPGVVMFQTRVELQVPTLTSIATASLMTYGKLNTEDPAEIELAATIIEQNPMIMFFTVHTLYEEVVTGGDSSDEDEERDWVVEDRSKLRVWVRGHKSTGRDVINTDIIQPEKPSDRHAGYHNQLVFFPAAPIGTVFLKDEPYLGKDMVEGSKVVGGEIPEDKQYKRRRVHC